MRVDVWRSPWAKHVWAYRRVNAVVYGDLGELQVSVDNKRVSYCKRERD